MAFNPSSCKHAEPLVRGASRPPTSGTSFLRTIVDIDLHGARPGGSHPLGILHCLCQIFVGAANL
jgi:hypothetical protein